MDQISDTLKFLFLAFRAEAIAGRKMGGAGLNFPDLVALYAISQAPEGRISGVDLVERIGLTDSYLSRLLGPLEKMNVIKKEPHGKSFDVVITPTGKVLFESTLKFAELRCADLIPENQKGELGRIILFLESMRP